MDKKAQTILSKFSKARTQRQLKDEKWKELDMFDRGEQWERAGNMPPWVPKPVTNYIHLVKTMKRASLAIKNPVGKLRPVSPKDIDSVKNLQNGYEYFWKKADCQQTTRDVIETSRLLGTGISHIYWESTPVKGGTDALYEGEIKTKQIDPSCVYPDPAAYRIDDCRYIHIVEKKPLEWLKKHPKFKDKMKGVTDPGQLVDDETGDIYARDKTAESDDGQIDFHSHYEKYRNSEGGWNYKVTYVAGETVVGEVDPLQPACYPFSVLYCYPQRKDFWGKGDCELILENQKIINKVESIIALLGTHLQNPQTVVDKRSGINPREVGIYGSAPGKVWVSNIRPDMAMTWRQPPPIPPVLFSLAETAAQNIREITGLTEAYMGQSIGSLQTSSGVNALIERSTLRDQDQMFDVEYYLEDFSRKLIMFMTSKQNDTRQIRKEMNGDEEVTQESFVEFRGSDFVGLDFDFFIDISSKAPISRARQKEEANQLLTIQGQYQFDPPVITPQEYINQSEMIHGDRIVNRMNRDEFMSNAKILEQVLMMANEAYQSDVPQQQVVKMSMQMLQQRMQAKEEGVGSANTGSRQMRQAGTPQ